MDATILETARSLRVIYPQLPDAVQTEFRRLLEHEEDDQKGWMRLTGEALREDWDEFCRKQNR